MIFLWLADPIDPAGDPILVGLNPVHEFKTVL
jgi:hypothetical protein